MKWLPKTFFNEKARTGLSRSTSGQLQEVHHSKSIVKIEKDGTWGHLRVISTHQESPSFMIKVRDGPESMCARGLTDGGTDMFILYACFDEKAVLNGFGKIKNMDKIYSSCYEGR